MLVAYGHRADAAQLHAVGHNYGRVEPVEPCGRYTMPPPCFCAAKMNFASSADTSCRACVVALKHEKPACGRLGRRGIVVEAVCRKVGFVHHILAVARKIAGVIYSGEFTMPFESFFTGISQPVMLLRANDHAPAAVDGVNLYAGFTVFDVKVVQCAGELNYACL